MKSPMPFIATTLLYLWFVLKKGPKYMKHRRPFDLTGLIRAYNLFQIAACSWFVFEFHRIGFSFIDMGKCVDRDRSDDDNLSGKMLYLKTCCWYFMVLRSAEYFETVFFVLKKSKGQISVLHVYHHISTLLIIWCAIKYSSGKRTFKNVYSSSTNLISLTGLAEIYIGAFNAAIHIIMYAYYFLSSFKNLRKYLSLVKRSLTAIQIVQLGIILKHLIAGLLPGCNSSRFLYVEAAVVAVMILLFANFFVQSYLKKSNRRKLE